MKFRQIVFLIIVLLNFISCQNGMHKEKEADSENNGTPSIDYQKTNKEFPSFNRQEPNEKPLKKELKKVKLKTIDTLKQLVAIP